jgi:peptide deformylase
MKIITTPNQILNQKALEVKKIDKKVLQIIKEMEETLLKTENPKGVGLAAPQIGISWRIFLVKPYQKSEIKVFINPKIIWQSPEMTDGVPGKKSKLEGCLSIPGVWGVVQRPKSIKLSYVNPEGKKRTQKFSGFLATIIQHEMDHLEGQLFSLRVLEQKGKFYKVVKSQQDDERLEELEFP